MQIKLNRSIFLQIVMFMIMLTGVGSADDVNVEILSDFGGNAYDVEVVGDHAYLGQGQDLVVLNIADIHKPSEVGRIITPSVVGAITVSGGYAYIADGNSGLSIVDITDPASPKLVGTYAGTYGNPAYSVVVSGHYAYVTNQFPGNLQIIDISDPSAPVLAGNYDLSGHGNANSLAISGNYAYVAASGLVILDISGPSPQPVSVYNDHTYAVDVVVSGNYAYVADADKGLVILNVTYPASPTLIGSYVTGNYAGYTRIAVSGNHVYGGTYDSLSIIDVSDLTSPQLKSTYATDGNTNNFAVIGDHAYIAGSGLEIVDISDPSLPVHVSDYYNGDWVWDVSVSGNYAYMTSWSSLTIADISDPSSPVFAGKYDIEGADEVDVQGNYAYVASGSSDSVLVNVLDIADSSAPKLIGSASLFADNGVCIDVEGNYACVGVGFPGLSILEISDPVSPQYVGSYGSYGPENYTQNVVVSGNYAYVIHDFELSILDISDPSASVLVSSYPTAVSDVAISGDHAYLAADDVLILDVSNPSAPKLAGSYDTAGAYSIAISGNYAYVVGGNGLIILNISDPVSPQLAGSYSDSTISGSVTVSGDHVYVANRERGLTILHVEISPATNQETTVSYTASYDNRLRESSPASVLSTTTYLDIGRSTSRCRDLMLFDLSGYRTTDKISKATLSLYWYYPATTRTSDTVVEIYRPVEWDPEYVTWRSRASGSLWSTAGGNWFDKNGVSQGSTPYASVTFPAAKVRDNKYYEFDVTQLVQDYVSGKYKNTGFFLKAKTESGNYIAFYSTDWSDVTQRPKLTITSTSGATSTDNVPVANAGEDQTVTMGSVITFDGSESTDDKGIGSYSWDFDAVDGVTSEASGATVTKAYSSAGTYTVTLTVTDTNGQTATDTLEVVVTEPVTSISYAPLYDNRLRESTPSTVLSSSNYIDIGKLSTTRYRNVMMFDLSGYQPTDTISRATLSLYWYYPTGATRAADTVVEIYRPMQWDTKYVTWNSRMSAMLWSTKGGSWHDKNGVSQGSVPYASLTFPASTVPDNKYYEFDVTELVQEYISGEYNNTGFFLKAKDENGNYIAFYSSEWPNADQRPKLTITR